MEIELKKESLKFIGKEYKNGERKKYWKNCKEYKIKKKQRNAYWRSCKKTF